MDNKLLTSKSCELMLSQSKEATSMAPRISIRRRDFVSSAGLVGAGLAVDFLHSRTELAGGEPQHDGVSELRIRPRYHRWHVDPGVEWIETNTSYAQLDWTIPLSQTALVLVDVWDHHYLRDTEARAEKIIDERLSPLIESCRKAHMPIIHAPSPTHAIRHPNWVGATQDSKVSAKRDEWPPAEFKNKSGAFASYRRPSEAREGELTKLRANLKMHPKIQPVADEPVIATGDELHELCKQRGILFLFFAGFNTNACILVRD